MLRKRIPARQFFLIYLGAGESLFLNASTSNTQKKALRNAGGSVKIQVKD